MSDAPALLLVAAAHKADADHLRRTLDTAREQVRAAQVRVDEARAKASAESADVTRLEGMTWTRILASIKGERDIELQREQAEERAARVLLAEAERRLAQRRHDADAVAARIAELGDVEAEYAAAPDAKAAWLSSTRSPAAERVTAISEELGRVDAEEAECREAARAGDAVRERLAEAIALLDDAGAWATWDTFAGGGLITDMIKYDRIDKVADRLRNVDAALTVFGRELGDVGMATPAGVRIDMTTQTFDVLFDNIFSDWAVRDKIMAASERVTSLSNQVEDVYRELTARLTALQARGAELRGERERLLTETPG